MMAHQRGARLRVLAGAFGTLLIAWGVEEIWRETPTVRAQQDNWTTPTAQRMGIRLLESHDAGGSVAYPVAAGDLLFSRIPAHRRIEERNQLRRSDLTPGPRSPSRSCGILESQVILSGLELGFIELRLWGAHPVREIQD
jgi:hypothetical protein